MPFISCRQGNIGQEGTASLQASVLSQHNDRRGSDLKEGTHTHKVTHAHNPNLGIHFLFPRKEVSYEKPGGAK